MSSVSSPTVSMTLSGIGATDFTKSEVDKGSIIRTSDNGLHSIQHIQSTTSKGRRRAVVRLSVSEPADPTNVATCTLTVDFAKGENAHAVIAPRALVDFLQANTWEEIDLLVAGHNYG